MDAADNTYKVTMKLTIFAVELADFGVYRCISKNSLGETDGSIKLYRKYGYNIRKFSVFFFCFCGSFLSLRLKALFMIAVVKKKSEKKKKSQSPHFGFPFCIQ